MDEYWQQSGETVTIQPSYETPQQHVEQQQDEEFDFSANQNNYESSNIGQSYNNMESTQLSSGMQELEENEIARQIREEQERINEQLRQKANQEYELKQARKQQARTWLENFFTQKQQQSAKRKQDNVRNQQQLLNDIKNSQTSQGWIKVSKSVDLKQSEYKGTKEINRMREAIIHKREDQSSA